MSDKPKIELTGSPMLKHVETKKKSPLPTKEDLKAVAAAEKK